MELELKYVSPYQAYKVKLIDHLENKCNISYLSTKKIAFIDVNGIGEVQKLKWEYATRQIKLILHPLSDLTKEIEVNGEKFIPYEKLFKKWLHLNIITFGHVSEETQRNMFDIQFNCVYEQKGYDNLQHWIYQDLIKWLFDIFGLIPEGLAVDINTL